jgi:aquaporin Z
MDTRAAFTPQARPIDAPLVGRPHPHDRLHPRMYAAEFAGTALLLAVGLSAVIVMFANGSPVVMALPSAAVRRAIAGFLFGCVGLLIALSPLGRISGAHVNPAVTLAFWLEGKIAWRDASFYVAAQFLGGIVGTFPLVAWGEWGRSVGFGVTLPMEEVPLWLPLLGEAVCTMLLVFTIFVLAAHARTRAFVPFAMPPLFSLLVAVEAPLSGTSTNPARSLGPALLTGDWQGLLIYFVGPCLGAATAVALLSLGALRHHLPHEARLFHFRHAVPAPLSRPQ